LITPFVIAVIQHAVIATAAIIICNLVPLHW
jgi:hypothetical protein